MSDPIKIDVWSDIACPWCFIGKRRLATAVAGFGGEVEIEYHSFELAPDTPVDFEGSEIDFLAGHKRMPEEQVRSMLAQMTELAASEGLSYDFDALQHTNTRLAHEALHAAKEQGRQADFKERLLTAYFEQGRHVGRVDELVELGAEIGLDAASLRAALENGTYREAVQADIDQAREYGIGGVPFYVIDGRWAVSGAQSPEVFAGALDQARSAR
ncbi:DsbA family oxidoreductase [Aeromicrobium sp. YIM 150415]|uniref:DsbA family oxidoreductase n=1 Tax=Aeromicrobium piscarium TaxID=2590901 RepID=A0A554S6Q9_9ACTN|nr:MULTISPECIES: DsbA family oxidoreductase [Aeromicrobium]MBM9464881.1 DsbA family oxidoreductase [Aeromicrobium sp. YIM 150415]TSD62041.1 DsbA family oxidoreductase [Aeromicrobium piscarium]